MEWHRFAIELSPAERGMADIIVAFQPARSSNRFRAGKIDLSKERLSVTQVAQTGTRAAIVGFAVAET